MTSKNDELTKLNSELQNNIKTYLNEIENLKKENFELKVQFTSEKETHETKLIEKLNEAETLSKNKLFELEDLKRVEREELQIEIVRLKNEISELNQLKEENINLRQQQYQLRNESQTSLANSNNNNGSINDIKLIAIRNENQSLQREIDELKSKLDDLSDENVSLNITINELKSAQQLNEKIKNLSRQLEV